MGKKENTPYFYQTPYAAAFYIFICTTLILGSWIWLTQNTWSRQDLFKGISSAFGIIGYVLFAFSLLLSSRWKKLEDWIGGLDRVYHLHHKLGMWGFAFILAHPLIHALKWVPDHLDKSLLFLLPLHHRLSVNLGVYAYWLMLIIILITIFKLLPYDKWKSAHKFMSVVFLLASLHWALSFRRFNASYASMIPLLIPFGLGLWAIFYKQVWMPIFYPYAKYHVTKTQKINDNVLMITLKPEGKALDFIPGQYAFFSFRENISREQHPFTIIQAQHASIEILTKIRGDFTRALYDNLSLDTPALLEGPYGRFDYRQGGKHQIWLAGGVGIVPFLAWCKTLKTWTGKIDLFYCVHRKTDEIFADELQHIQDTHDFFKLHIYCTENGARLTGQNILDAVGHVKNRDIFMCGPRRLTTDFVKVFQKMGVKRKQIHFEDFEFF